MKKRKYQKYGDEEKASVLAVLAANSGNASKTARQSGVLRQTINRWKNGIGVNDEVATMLHFKKEELRDLYKLIAVKALGLLQYRLAECSPLDLAMIAAMCTDRMLKLDR